MKQIPCLHFFYLVFSYTIHPNHSFFPPWSSTSPLYPRATQTHLPQQEKKQASQGYQQDMAQQTTIRTGTFPPIKAGRGNPVEERESQEQARVRNSPIPLSGICALETI